MSKEIKFVINKASKHEKTWHVEKLFSDDIFRRFVILR